MYIDNPGLLLAERSRAVPLLLRALPQGDLELRREILLLLGTFAKEEISWPLYAIMTDPREPDEFRDQAAIYMSVIGAFLDDPQPLIRRLVADLDNGDPEMKVRAVIALGWEGNLQAVLPLIECLYDSDQEIQEVAVTALCNLREGRVMRLLADRMTHCSPDQKRAILFNLWRFRDRQDEVVALYQRELENGDPALRLDVLMLLGQLDEQPAHEALYRSLLHDVDPRIRGLALERLGAMGAVAQEEALIFVRDPAMDVKRAAMKVLQDCRRR